MKQYRLTIWHGEGRSLYYVVDAYAKEQPAIIETYYTLVSAQNAIDSLNAYTSTKDTIDGRPVWFRWTTAKGPTWDRQRALGPLDVSPRANQYHPGQGLDVGEADYDADCSLCWLHIGHTSDLHRYRLMLVKP